MKLPSKHSTNVWKDGTVLNKMEAGELKNDGI